MVVSPAALPLYWTLWKRMAFGCLRTKARQIVPSAISDALYGASGSREG